MPFDFTMYLLKADDCCDDDVNGSKASVTADSDVNNEKSMMTSEPITCIPGKARSFSKSVQSDSPVSVYSFSRAHIFNKNDSNLRRELENLKMVLHRANNKNMVCYSKKTDSSGLKCSGIVTNNSKAKTKYSGPFTTMIADFTRVLEQDHDESTCYFNHCHLCKGPKRALSIDSAKARPKCRRKVSFADDNGMPLTKVRVMPNSSENDTTSPITSLDIYGVHGRYKQLRLDFPQPAADFNAFLERLRSQNVSLENVMTDGTSFLGTVRVKNLAMEKEVRMRFTTDNWVTWTDIVASYVYEDATSCYDLFGFHVSVGHLPDEVQFAICYKVRDEEHWDNNDGNNYRLKMISH